MAIKREVDDKKLYIVTDKVDASINNKAIKAARGDRLRLSPTEASVLKYVVLQLNKDES